MTRNPVGKLLLFGATGDLSQRMLLPSLFNLHSDGLLPDGLTITGTARSDHDDASFREFASHALDTFLPEDRKDADKIESFLSRLQYQSLDASKTDGFPALAEKVGDVSNGLAIYLSTAPSLFESTIKGLESVGLAGETVRIGLEKPLGYDLASSKEINDAVAFGFPEERTFRIDHYLGKETVQNILALRFGNFFFEPIWNAHGIDNVQITIAETVGLEDRAGYYEGAGALRDMVQNHILQLLALIAMEPPARYDGTAIRDEKAKVFRSLRQMTPEEVPHNTVTGQYVDGAVGGKIVGSYADELGKPSKTETFVAIKAHVDNWRWQGVPFYLRTGKRMATRRSEIAIQFKPVPHSMFAGRGGILQPNTLVIRLQPEEYIQLLVMAKEPGLDREGLRLREVPLNLSLDAEFAGTRRRIAYERLLLDLIEGDQTLFVRRDEVEAQWAWIDAIRAGWDANDVKPKHYPSGSWGPSAAIALTERDGVTWQDD
ncbi:glucose-6-phosphate dehydrogenase [Sphingomonas sp. S17]|uniref:Glucose-6-phosphate 1-dehydrogenase n=2 Tax=Sphingomonas paucimobilis TaxID=13689 RepID=A0A411LEZ6_SPHPI|nr:MULTISPECIES: glucose-6-phosphate dehydrogenase [Sphingomonas]EGI56776.1 glucose-6-phosphate dehydrogenase [Sphingomonas sp. S17]MBQ1480186.1 glucose-6-phosphate dehydrogenase [Sphingomonas sp.]MCM3678911.1 glucose-6-phosphate dehydrogenase [Sphingomonas paucimobilis]MDG5971663.1 glucose-6-phosphate dehydrogenase [Sphingomonas paucimobilis]NNG58323.1 glucose-6-phosphate dehydrogenase [Sphingomonas paucimobilis]